MSKAKVIKTYRQERKRELIYIMGGKCQICGYNKCDAALEFHHCDPQQKKYGISNGNCRSLERDLEEVKKCILLCSNCHREVEFYGIKTEPSFNQAKADEILQKRKEKENKTLASTTCPICGKAMTRGAKLCAECSYKNRRTVERPTREELKQMIRTLPFTTIGERYGVVDNSVRKWCINYNLPSRKKDINSITDEEWEKI